MSETVWDIKVHVLSRSVALAECLDQMNIDVKIYDPYYNEKEIKDITGCRSFDFPKGLNEFDCVIVIPQHIQFKAVNQDDIIKNLKNCKEIIDNMGMWKEFKFPEEIKYHEVGDAGWLR